jgi:potassium efflux system protein
VLAAPAAAAGAQPHDAPPSPTGPEIEAVELTVEAIEARIKQVEETADLDEALKAKILEAYRQALEQLRIQGQWKETADEFEQKKRDAPRALEEIGVELARPAAEPEPEVPDGASLEQLEQLLAQQEAALSSLESAVAALEGERQRRADRKLTIPTDTASARQKLDEVTTELGAAPPPDEPPALTLARRMLLTVRKAAYEQEMDAYEKEVLSYEARGDLLTARWDLAARRETDQEFLVRVWQGIVNEHRRAEARRAAQEAEQMRREAVRAHPIVRKLAEENAVLAGRRTNEALPDLIEHASHDLEQFKEIRSSQERRSASVKHKVELVGLTQAMGLLLRRELETLPHVRDHQRNVQRRSSELSNLQVKWLNTQDDLDALANIERHLRGYMAQVDPTVPDRERAEIESTLRELLENRREYLESLYSDYSAYLDKLLDLNIEERQLITETEEYAGYIKTHVLWLPSASVPRLSEVRRTGEAIVWLIDPEHWKVAAWTCWDATRERPLKIAFGVLVFIALLLPQRRLRDKLAQLGNLASASRADSISPTLTALAVTILIAAPWPALLWVVRRCLGSLLEAPDFAKAASAGLGATAGLFLTVEFLRQTCRLGGLAGAHFDWPARSLKLVRRHVLWLMSVGLPLAFIISAVEWEGDEDRRTSLGRLAFVMAQAALALFVQRLLRPSGGIAWEALRRNPDGWLNRLRYLWYPLAVGLPLLLAVLALAGYYYTALQLTTRLVATLWLILGLLVLNALLLRWVLVARRKLAIEQHKKRRAAELAETEIKGAAEPPAKGTAAAHASAPDLDLSTISVQTRNLVRSAAGLALIIGAWLVWVDVLPALDMLRTFELWSTTASAVDTSTGVMVQKSVPVTLADLLFAALALLMTFIAGKNIPGALEIAILQRLPVEPAGRYAITSISRYVITIIGLVMAFGAVGIRWSTVQWLAAAVTVGLGFGLQEIFANFASGLIVLFERPIRVGDIVTVGGVEGKVTRIRIRATTITDWDRRELIVPNKQFVTGQVMNWTLSDPITRVVIPVGIAHGSDTKLARDLLLKVARDCPLVMGNPHPTAIFKAFGESALSFELRVFIATRDVWPELIDELHTAIDNEFRKAGIEIAFR